MLRTLLIAVLWATPPLRALAEPLEPRGPTETFSLEDATHLAMRNSPELQTAEQAVTIARQRVKEAVFLFVPEVGLQASATRFQARYPFALRPGFRSILLFPSNDDNLYSGQAYMTLSLYEGRRHIHTLQLAKTALKQAQSKCEAVKLDIAYRVQEAFYRLILAQERSKGLTELSAALGRSGTEGREALEAIETKALASELRATESAARHETGLARLDFLKGLNKEFDIQIVVDGKLETKPVDVDLNKVILWATELRPELQSQTYKTQMDAISVSLALGRRNPRVLLGLDYEVTGQDFPLRQNNWDATLGIQIPFSLDYWTQHTQKVAEQRQSEIARSELQDQVRLEVRKAHRDLAYWQEEWPRREREYEDLRRSAQTLLKSGSALRSLKAARHVLDTRSRYLEAMLEHILAKARLERAIGRSLPDGS